MVAAEATGLFDLWSLLVVNVFGGFWLAVFFLVILMAIILMFGRVSIYSVILFLLMFLYSMTLGYGFILFNVISTILIVGGLIWSIMGWLTRAGQ